MIFAIKYAILSVSIENRGKNMDYNKIRRAEKQNKKQNNTYTIVTLTFALVAVVLGVVILIPQPSNEKNVAKVTQAPQTAIPTSTEVVSSPVPTAVPTTAPTQVPVTRRGTAQAIPSDIREYMTGKSYKANGNISLDDLSYLTIPHYDFNYNVTEGHLVVNKALAEEVLDIFAELFDVKYPIERMELIDKYGADDYESIEYNNTSAFNYRKSTSGNSLSNHAYGRAIDLNPQINPYVNSSGTGAHQNAREYWSRDTSKWTSEIAKAAYMGPGTDIYNIFVNKHGWTWGGSWSSYRDYQHFEKK